MSDGTYFVELALFNMVLDGGDIPVQGFEKSGKVWFEYRIHMDNNSPGMRSGAFSRPRWGFFGSDLKVFADGFKEIFAFNGFS
jgi:hypothetical protein